MSARGFLRLFVGYVFFGTTIAALAAGDTWRMAAILGVAFGISEAYCRLLGSADGPLSVLFRRHEPDRPPRATVMRLGPEVVEVYDDAYRVVVAPSKARRGGR